MSDIEVTILKNKQDLDEVLGYLKQHFNDGSVHVLDVETDSSTPQTATLYGLGISVDENQAFYIPFKSPEGKSLVGDLYKKDIQNFLLSQNMRVVGHNLSYDVIVLKQQLGVDLVPKIYCDTILLKHTVDEERPHGLKETAVKYLGSWADKAQQDLYDSIEDNGGSTTKENLEMYKASTEVLGTYCGWDVCLTYKLLNILSKKLEEEKLQELFYEKEVMPLYKEVTIPMIEKGFPVDTNHLQKLQVQIQSEIDQIESGLYNTLKDILILREAEVLEKKAPVKRSGKFPVVLAEVSGVKLPINPKTGQVTLSAKALAETLDQESPFYKWITEQSEGEGLLLEQAQKELYFSKYPNRRYVFNFKSADDLKWLFFDQLKKTPLSTTETGEPQVNEDFIETMDYPWVQDLLDFKRLIKLESTYITGMLDVQINGVVYPSWMQFGTTSGRYSCSGPNLQQIPRIREEDSDEISERVKKYFNQIKAAFIAPEGYKLVNADYSQLEPCAFACASGDAKLQESFRKGHDLYSSIAIEAFGLEGYSANKKDSNYLGAHKKDLRQVAKVIALATVYGAGAGRLSSTLKVDKEEAQKIIDDYLSAYPQLKSYMETCDLQAITLGKVTSRFGRVRHLKEAKELYKIYGDDILDEELCRRNKKLREPFWKLKGLLNLAKNHPIQATAAYIVNQASIAVTRKMKEVGIEGYVAGQVHDEICCIVKEKDADKVKELLKSSMESTTIIEVPLRADPLIGKNWAEAK
jgi:DNA polymerase I-like protein with 3'-5' exonuclease and polymerase domains